MFSMHLFIILYAPFKETEFQADAIPVDVPANPRGSRLGNVCDFTPDDPVHTCRTDACQYPRIPEGHHQWRLLCRGRRLNK